jgi:anti-sigma factor RsiW
MKCKRYRDEMEDWLDGELAGDARLELERHLHACPDCAQYFAQRRAMGSALKRSLHELTAGLHFQPRPLSWRPAEKRSAWRRLWLDFAPRLLAAAAVVMLITLLFLFQPWTKERPNDAAATKPIAVITVSDSLNDLDESFIFGHVDGCTYRIHLQVSVAQAKDHS